MSLRQMLVLLILVVLSTLNGLQGKSFSLIHKSLVLLSYNFQLYWFYFACLSSIAHFYLGNTMYSKTQT